MAFTSTENNFTVCAQATNLHEEFEIHTFEITATSPGDQIIIYPQTSNIGHTLVVNKIVDHSDVVGAVPVNAASTTSSFST